MAKKQSRRSVSLSRLTYERLRAYCESNGVSMSQFVEGRIGDFLTGKPLPAITPSAAPITTIKKPEVVIKPAPPPIVAAPVAAPAPVAPPAPRPAPVAVAPAPAPVRVAVPSAPNPGQRPVAPPAPVEQVKKPVDEAAARRAAERIFTF